MTKLPEIHPCICGQTAGPLLNYVHPVHTKGYLVACTRCGRAGHLGTTKAQAIERWNAATDRIIPINPGPILKISPSALMPWRWPRNESTHPGKPENP